MLNDAVTTASAITEVTTAVGSVWTLITGNLYMLLPIAAGVLGIAIRVIKKLVKRG